MTKIVEQTESRLVVRVGDPTFAGLLLALAVGFGGVALALSLTDPQATGTERFQGLVAGSLLFLVGFLAVFEQAEFGFDRPTRTLRWQRCRAFGQRSGAIPFDQIQAVVAQPSSSESGGRVPKWRVALLLATGELPLTVAYAPDPNGSVRALARTLEEFLTDP